MSDHRRSLQYLLVALHQPVDSRGQQRVDRRGDRQALDRRDQTVGAPRALEVARLDESAHGLFGEERIAAGPGVHCAGDASEALVLSEETLDQLSNRVGAER